MYNQPSLCLLHMLVASLYLFMHPPSLFIDALLDSVQMNQWTHFHTCICFFYCRPTCIWKANLSCSLILNVSNSSLMPRHCGLIDPSKFTAVTFRKQAYSTLDYFYSAYVNSSYVYNVQLHLGSKYTCAMYMDFLDCFNSGWHTGMYCTVVHTCTCRHAFELIVPNDYWTFKWKIN